MMTVTWYDCLVGLVVASSTAEQEVLGSILESDKVLLKFSIRDFLVVVTDSGLCLVNGNRLAPVTWDLKEHDWRNEGVLLGSPPLTLRGLQAQC